MEKASRLAPKVIYMAACLLTETPFEKIIEGAEFINKKLIRPDFMKLKGLRKVDSVGYGYIVKADRLLSGYEVIG